MWSFLGVNHSVVDALVSRAHDDHLFIYMQNCSLEIFNIINVKDIMFSLVFVFVSVIEI